MPRGNGTGPMGMGPMTGRALGRCAGNTVPGCMTPGANGRGRGLGLGRGRGRGMGRAGVFVGSFQTPQIPFEENAAPLVQGSQAVDASEVELLKTQADAISRTLETIAARISSLEETAAKEHHDS